MRFLLLRPGEDNRLVRSNPAGLPAGLRIHANRKVGLIYSELLCETGERKGRVYGSTDGSHEGFLFGRLGVYRSWLRFGHTA